MVSEDVRKIVGRKRTLEILELLSEQGTLNYSEIEDTIDSSSETISTALKQLVNHGLVQRIEQSSRNVQYESTESGNELLDTLEEIERILSD
ncbi:winged helix-turn-helix transcriptional regulator [Haloarcula sp. 1CSR25-25]|uniref:winged helix-turn-helix transcriptional regulator n=1 Tax=Haloarcula sp. 1CSR25-25 TaxID=2862545 RepID=UPI0028945061|nr:winged helix-turn-helix transcriptional regulator [Haloarcula sp. 1CSR25-25]MDT3433248.1 winged helix-turn-helix transcriptional regulator [Haloarcula sp. 1CSR25-25]